MSRISHVSPPDARPKAYPALRNMCLNYEFWPSQHLQVDELARLLRLSPTPVREALARLAGEGLVQAVPNRGYFAKSPILSETDAMIELKYLLLSNTIANEKLPYDWRVNQPENFVVSSNINANFELLVGSVGAMSKNALILDSIQSLLERTRYIRRIILQSVDAKSSAIINLQKLSVSLKSGCKESALSAIQCLCDSHRTHLPLAISKAQSRIISTEPQLPLPACERRRMAHL
jgi:DNA-binding GntR family transcriptional regulator